MFAGSYFPSSYFPPNYWPKTGGRSARAAGGVGIDRSRRRILWQAMEQQNAQSLLRSAYRSQLRNTMPPVEAEQDKERMVRAAATYAVLLSEI